jgi:hypothetical protein
MLKMGYILAEQEDGLKSWVTTCETSMVLPYEHTGRWGILEEIGDEAIDSLEFSRGCCDVYYDDLQWTCWDDRNIICGG